MRLIVTRPEPDASRTARALIALGYTAILSPMLDIVHDRRAPLPAGDHQAVLATSSNGVRALIEHAESTRLARLPLLTVGDHTALEARRAGFAEARSAGGSVADLAALAGSVLDPAAGPLLYVAGETRTGDLEGRLAAQGFSVATVVLYRSEPRARLAAVAAAALRAANADGILLYSRRSADAFAAALSTEGLAPLAESVACFCLSQAVAEPLARVTAGPIIIAERPEQIALFAAIERFAAGRETQ